MSDALKDLIEEIEAICSYESWEPQDVSLTQLKASLIGQGAKPDGIRSFAASLSALGGLKKVVAAGFPAKATPAKVEKEVVRKAAAQTAKQEKVLVNDAIYMEQFIKAIKVNMTNGVPKTFGYALRKPVGYNDYVAHIFLSDLHFGSDLKEEEGFLRYGFVEEARCLASIVQRVCEFKPEHRKDTELAVSIGGDLIRGKIHDKEYCMPLATQTCDAMYLLNQAIRVWANHFKKVTVRCVGGNHDRNPDTKRQISARFDTEATKIYYGIKIGVQDLPNVTVEIPMGQVASFEVFGKRVYLSHGDINLLPGYPGSSIKTKDIATQISNKNMAEIDLGNKPYSLFMLGHVHTGALVHLPHGDLITNGTMMPPDGYAQSATYYATSRGQVMFESVATHVVGDYRFLGVDKYTHKDKSLDKLIRPFPGTF